MPDLINKLTTYGSLVGVVCAIGGGFYAWGEFNTRLDAMEKKKFIVNQTVDLSSVNKEIKELNEKINDRVNALGAAHDEDYIALLDTQAADYNELQDTIRALAADIESLKADIAINGKAIEFNGIKIEEAIARSENPLAN